MQFPTNSKPESVVNKNDARTALLNCYVDTTGPQPHLVATDGHMLVAIPVIATTDEQGYVSPVALKAARKLAKKNELAEIACNGSLGLTDGTQYPRPTQEEYGRFPQWQMVLPKPDRPTAVRIGVNAAYLKAIADALGQDEVILEIGAEGAVDPIVVLPMTRTDTRKAVLMPIKVR